MRRPPRSADEHLVSGHLLAMAYAKIGLLQVAAGMTSYVTIMAQHGLFWSNLVGSRKKGWLDVHLEDYEDDFGQQWVSFNGFEALKILTFFLLELRRPSSPRTHLSDGLLRVHRQYAMV